MRYADITTCDLANGKNLGIVLWCQGCSLDCPGCHNDCAHNPEEGKEFDSKAEALLFKELQRPQLKRVTLSGGHPLEPYNIDTCLDLCKRIKQARPEIQIWCYTGWLWEVVKNYEIMKYLDVLVDGPYMESLRDVSLAWRGSSNQRVIDVRESLKTGEVVTLDD